MTKRLFNVKWINRMTNGTVIQTTPINAKTISGACRRVEMREGCISVISATMVTGPLMSDKNVETVKDYESAAR